MKRILLALALVLSASLAAAQPSYTLPKGVNGISITGGSVGLSTVTGGTLGQFLTLSGSTSGYTTLSESASGSVLTITPSGSGNYFSLTGGTQNLIFVGSGATTYGANSAMTVASNSANYIFDCEYQGSCKFLVGNSNFYLGESFSNFAGTNTFDLTSNSPQVMHFGPNAYAGFVISLTSSATGDFIDCYGASSVLCAKLAPTGTAAAGCGSVLTLYGSAGNTTSYGGTITAGTLGTTIAPLPGGYTMVNGPPYGSLADTTTAGISIPITCTAAGTWYSSTASLTVSGTNGFTVTGGSKMTCVVPGMYLVEASLSLSGTAANDIIGIGVMTNGAIATNSVAQQAQFTASKVMNLATSCIVSLSANDYLTLGVEDTTTAGMILTLQHAHLTVLRISN